MTGYVDTDGALQVVRNLRLVRNLDEEMSACSAFLARHVDLSTAHGLLIVR